MAKEVINGENGRSAFANRISDEINTALCRGIPMDEAVSIVVTVAADYARGAYGDDYLVGLAEVIEGRAGAPMPRTEVVQ